MYQTKTASKLYMVVLCTFSANTYEFVADVMSL